MVTLAIGYNDFYYLTPVMLSYMFYFKQMQIEEQLIFQMSQTRLTNFYQIVATQGTKNISSPEKLYALPREKENNVDEEFLLSPLSEDEIKILSKL